MGGGGEGLESWDSLKGPLLPVGERVLSTVFTDPTASPESGLG